MNQDNSICPCSFLFGALVRQYTDTQSMESHAEFFSGLSQYEDICALSALLIITELCERVS